MRYIRLAIIVIMVGLGVTSFISIKSCNKQRELTDRWKRNSYAVKGHLNTYRDKNGELVTINRGLEAKASDLQLLNANLHNELQAMNVKLKNALSAVTIKTEYIYLNADTLIYIWDSDSTRNLTINEDYLKLNCVVKYDSIIEPERLSISIPNKQYIVTELRYKGWWIFKRYEGIQIQVKNSNRYIDTDSIFYIQFKYK